jgi:tRNA dimethylallyltransferase
MRTIACDCWFLTGPTASGKTSVGLAIAQRIGAEIISLDSMAIYRGMDIGTAKPTSHQRSLVPHHLIDIIDPTEDFSLSRYVDAAQAKIREIRARGKEVLFVGGTPLYLKALLRGMFHGPSADWAFRRKVHREARVAGIEVLHERLKLVDPLSAARLHPHDTRRIIRALEVHKLTGEPISHRQLQFDEVSDAQRVFVLDWPRDQLDRRIDQRVEGMFESGLVEEVQQLLGRYHRLSRTATQAVGYWETIEFLAGGLTRPEAIHRTRARTRRFARRQLTWFRSLPECRAVACSLAVSPLELAGQIVAAASPSPSERPAK